MSNNNVHQYLFVSNARERIKVFSNIFIYICLFLALRYEFAQSLGELSECLVPLAVAGATLSPISQISEGLKSPSPATDRHYTGDKKPYLTVEYSYLIVIHFVSGK